MFRSERFNESFYQSFLNDLTQRASSPVHDSLWKEEIIPPQGLSVEECLSIYQTDYRSRLTEALGEVYPTVWRILGDQDFFQLCADYIEFIPSTSFNLGQYGHQLSTFLRKTHHLSNQEFPFLPILAEMEWTFLTFFHADETPASNQSLENLSQNISLQVIALMKLFYAPVNLECLWQHQDSEQSPPEELWNKEQWLLLYKVQKRIHFWDLKPFQFQLLQQLQQGLSLDVIFEQDCWNDIHPEEIQQTFQEFSQRGLIQHFT
jgi:hypothetical protein